MMNFQLMLKIAIKKSSASSRRHLIESWKNAGVEAARISKVIETLTALKLI